MTDLDAGRAAHSAELTELAQRYGVATEYWDWRNQHIVVPAGTIIAVLRALGVAADTSEQRRAALIRYTEDRWRRSLPATVVAQAGATTPFWVHVTDGDPVEVEIELETGGRRTGIPQLDKWVPPYEIDGRRIGEATFEVPGDLPLGYHQLIARSGDNENRTALIVTPAWLGLPEAMGEHRTWGLAAQLYSVRSRQSWGVGDLTDLTDLAVWAGSQHGAGYVLVNPLHAAEPIVPMEPSPYLPTSRRFTNPIYLRVERIPEYAELNLADRRAIFATKARLDADTAATDAIDRNASWTAKRTALERVYGIGRSAGRELAYQAYRHREGRGLDDFAIWCALTETHGTNWHEWPDGLRHPGSSEVATFAREHHTAIDFYRWLQWLMDEQLAAAQAAATRAGMAVGIVHDLAVGVHPDGADSWALQDVLAKGISAGAPPDAFNQNGQDWSQPPWRPDQLAEQAYAPVRAMVNAVLRNGGGVRIDHIIGLFRLWWIPDGAGPNEGTYVRYDHDAMIGVVALEAHRARALVVGEDLGVVEPWVRDYLKQRGILGTSILWFEFDYEGGGGPLPAERWRELCLSSVTTHDLPPSAGYLAGDHVRLRQKLGLLTRSLDEELAADQAEQTAWLDELRRRGLLADSADSAPSADGAADVAATVTALHRYLTHTPSRLLALALTDAVGDRRTQNQPGTTDEYPNWRVPLTDAEGHPLLLEDIFTSARAAALAQTFTTG